MLYGDAHLNKIGLVVAENANHAQVLRQAGRAAALELGYKASKGEHEMYVLLGADNNMDQIPHGAFVVYIGHHGDAGAERADVILPAATYAEKDGTFANLEGRVQRTRTAVPPPGEARVDWQIISALAEVSGKALGIEDELQLLGALSEYGLHRTKSILKSAYGLDTATSDIVGAYAETESVVKDYYMTDVISRASPTMAKCSETFSTTLTSEFS